VHRDGHVEFEKSFYSVPPEYLGREVWVRGDSRVVRIFNLRMEEVAVHVRGARGRAETKDEHIHPLKRRLIDRGVRYLLSRCGEIGPACGAWAEAVHHHRPIEGVRAIQGLLPLAKEAYRRGDGEGRGEGPLPERLAPKRGQDRARGARECGPGRLP
jgi:hypothetical protein